MLSPWTSSPSAGCSTPCRSARSRPTTPSTGSAACPSPTSGSPASTTTGRCARAWPRPSTARARPPNSAAAIVAELLSAPGSGPVLLTRADDAQVAAALDRNPDGHRTGVAHATVAWRVAEPRSERVVVATAGTADLPVADECAATLAAHGLEPIRRHRRGGGRRPPPARLGRRPGRRRRRRRRRRHGGRPGQRRRGHHRRRRWSRCPRASATAPASRGSPRCSACWRRAPQA